MLNYGHKKMTAEEIKKNRGELGIVLLRVDKLTTNKDFFCPFCSFFLDLFFFFLLKAMKYKLDGKLDGQSDGNEIDGQKK